MTSFSCARIELLLIKRDPERVATVYSFEESRWRQRDCWWKVRLLPTSATISSPTLSTRFGVHQAIANRMIDESGLDFEVNEPPLPVADEAVLSRCLLRDVKT